MLITKYNQKPLFVLLRHIRQTEKSRPEPQFWLIASEWMEDPRVVPPAVGRRHSSWRRMRWWMIRRRMPSFRGARVGRASWSGTHRNSPASSSLLTLNTTISPASSANSTPTYACFCSIQLLFLTILFTLYGTLAAWNCSIRVDHSLVFISARAF